MQDYERVYNDFWKDIVENPDGTLNRDQVMRELFDYQNVMNWTSEVYCAVTDEQVSKPNTSPGVIIELVNERIDRAVNAAIDELQGVTGS